MLRGGGLAALTALAALILAPAASAQYPPSPPGMGGGGEPGGAEPAAEIEARGNAFTGGLEFFPDDVSVAVGELVRWRNTDQFVPHTATEDHFLWRETGTYGEPSPYVGFGPGETRDRSFEAGAFSYFCEVHPEDMHGVVRVPVSLRQARGARLKATWETEELPEDEVFDVQRREGKKWQTVLDGTRKSSKTFASEEGKAEQFRARLRFADEEKGASGWSPTAKLKVK